MRDDDPEDLLGELSDEALFGDHPLGRPVIGSEESVRGDGPRRRCTRSGRGSYTTPRMIVAAAGNLRHGEVVELVGTALAARDGPGERRAARRPRGGPRPALLAPGPRLVLRPDDTEQAHLMLGVPGLSRHDPRRSRAVGAQHRARRRAELAAVPAGPRAARAGVLGVLVVGVATPTRAPSASTPGARRSGWARSSTVIRGVLAEVAAHGLTAGRGRARAGQPARRPGARAARTPRRG